MSKKKQTVNNSFVIGVSAGVVTSAIVVGLCMQIFKTEPIIVAARDLNAYSGEPLTVEDFKTIHVSSRNKSDFIDFVDNVANLVGTIPTTNIVQNQPVKRSQFINPEDAQEVQQIVSSDVNRGIYLPLSFSNVLFGDLKIGSAVDLYILTDKPSPTPEDPDNTVKVVLPFQMSFRVNKMKMLSDSEYVVFFDYPMEESEQYIMLKELLDNGDAELIATMPNLLHKGYDGLVMTEDEFKTSLLAVPNYFSKINKEESKEDSDLTINVDNNQTTEGLTSTETN